jgi:hypothetical protein
MPVTIDGMLHTETDYSTVQEVEGYFYDAHFRVVIDFASIDGIIEVI